VTRGACPDLQQAPSEVAAAPPEGGCAECLATGHHDWVHLRLCLTCGHVGCCDSSPGRHATAHHEATGHPVIRSHQPGETWRWCYVHECMG
jgi:CPA1 family monovalent cation:H+ antiporter